MSLERYLWFRVLELFHRLKVLEGADTYTCHDEHGRDVLTLFSSGIEGEGEWPTRTFPERDQFLVDAYVSVLEDLLRQGSYHVVHWRVRPHFELLDPEDEVEVAQLGHRPENLRAGGWNMRSRLTAHRDICRSALVVVEREVDPDFFPGVGGPCPVQE